MDMEYAFFFLISRKSVPSKKENKVSESRAQIDRVGQTRTRAKRRDKAIEPEQPTKEIHIHLLKRELCL